MDEYLFMTLAKLKADRLKLQRDARLRAADPEQLRLDIAEPARPARRFSQQPLKEGTVMSTRTTLALAAALVINATAMVAWEWNVNEQLTPAGEVTITQIEEPTQVALAQGPADAEAVLTANRSL